MVEEQTGEGQYHPIGHLAKLRKDAEEEAKKALEVVEKPKSKNVWADENLEPIKKLKK